MPKIPASTLGYTQFHMDQFFHAVEKRMEKNEKL